MIKVKSVLLLGMLLLMQVCTASADTIPVESFFKNSSFRQVRISPDGKYLAATVPLDDSTALVIMDLESKKITGHYKPQDTVHVTGFDWVGPKRVLFSIASQMGKYAAPVKSAGLFAMNADGTNVGTAYAAGYYPRILDTLKNDDKYILIQYRSDRGGDTIGRMNMENGDVLPTYRKSPGAGGYGSFVVDNAAEARFYVLPKNLNDTKVYIRKGEAWDWQIFHDSAATGQDIEFRTFSADNTLAYYTLTQSSGPDALYVYNFATGEKKQIARDDNVNPSTILSSPVDESPYALRYDDGFPRIEWLDKSNPYAQDLMKMQASFPEADVMPVSSTLDGIKTIYAVYSDTIAADFYLYNRDSKKAEHLLSAKSWLAPERMALMEPIKIKARDGLELEAFLTVPKGSSGKNLPLIIHPHGGPFGPYDQWQFNPEIQFLANHGYAVLQVNYRGSGNYGKEFQKKGYKQWGKLMQDDLTDATRWAVAQGIASSSRICIYGASYGAYAALMGVAKEPNLYKCAVGNVGVYDLPDMVAYDAGRGGSMNQLKVFFKDTFNTEDASSSPARVAGQVKVPVYLMAGSKDPICPPEQTKKMHKALLEAGVPVEMHIYEGEMHGNVLIKNQIDFANRLLTFLDKNLKPEQAQVGGQSPAK